MKVVLGIDLGTSYFKLGLFDREGRLQGLGRVPVVKHEGDGTLCELPVAAFQQYLRTGLADALAQAGARSADIVALGYSSQANSFLLLDGDGTPLTPLILYPDQRAKSAGHEAESIWRQNDFQGVTGMGIGYGPGFAVEKVCWFRKHQPQTWAGTRRIMTISDFLTYALTHHCAGDAGTASLLGMLDVQNVRWWPDALDAIKLPAAMLSQPLRPGTVAGRVTQDGAERLGLPAGIPLAVGSLDHHVASLGAGVGTIAPFSESTGTILACIGPGKEFKPAARVCVGVGFDPGSYYRLAFDSNGAGVLEWYHATHAPHLSFRELDQLADAVPADCDGLVALPSAHSHTGLDGFRNVAARHTPGHFARAIMASAAASLGELVDRLCPAGRPARIVATGGGAKSDFWLQLKADALGIQFVRTQCEEPACNGAAMLAAVAAGWFPGLAQAGEAWIRASKVFQPRYCQKFNERMEVKTGIG
jgi:sugar (pentulose or hexulose) kinase